VDEAIVVDAIKSEFKKSKFEVFFPTNIQLKDIDLILLDLKKMKVKTLQVKGSRTYTNKSDIKRFGPGSNAWFTINKESIFKPSNHVDFFIFVLHCFVDVANKKEIQVQYLVIPIKEFQAIAKKKKEQGGKYNFYIWINSKGEKAFEWRNPNHKQIPLSKYLNAWDLLK
jgi:hypothetical protein